MYVAMSCDINITAGTIMTQKLQIKAYEKNFDKLVNCLPMQDALFTAALSTLNLLPGNTNNEIEALRTAPEKASYFLKTVVKPALVINDTSSFERLLSFMEHCGFDHVEKLASRIKSEIDETSNTEQGTYSYNV